MTQISIGSTLSYEVRAPTIFLFKIAAAVTAKQAIHNEVLTFEPDLAVEQCQIGEEGNRLHRVVVQPCHLMIRYEALAEIQHEIESLMLRSLHRLQFIKRGFDCLEV